MYKKVCIISGGMGAVGQAIAKSLLMQGYAVSILYRSASPEDIEQAKVVLGEHILFIQCDLVHPDEVTAAIEKTIHTFGTIDVCVHAAVEPIVRVQLLAQTTERFKTQFEVGLFGGFSFITQVAKVMVAAKRGTIIGITSSGIEQGSGGARMGVYNTAKYALRGLLRELHKELRPSNIRVFAVAPDLMQTKLNADLPDKYFTFAAEHLPNKKLMTPEAVSEIVDMLIADSAIDSGVSILVSNKEVTPL